MDGAAALEKKLDKHKNAAKSLFLKSIIADVFLDNGLRNLNVVNGNKDTEADDGKQNGVNIPPRFLAHF